MPVAQVPIDTAQRFTWTGASFQIQQVPGNNQEVQRVMIYSDEIPAAMGSGNLLMFDIGDSFATLITPGGGATRVDNGAPGLPPGNFGALSIGPNTSSAFPVGGKTRIIPIYGPFQTL